MTGFNPAHIAFKDDKFTQLKQLDLPLDLKLDWQDVKDQTRRARFNVTKYGDAPSANLPVLGPIQDLAIAGEMDIINGTLSLDAVDFSTRDIDVNGAAEILGLFAQGEDNTQPIGFNVALEKLHWEAEDVLSRPLTVKNGRIKGEFKPEDSVILLSESYLPLGNHALKAQGQIDGFIGSGTDKQPSIKLKGGFEGALAEYDLLALWPTNFILGGRNWIKSSIVAATLSDMTFDVDISDFSKLEGGLPDDAVKLDFRVSDGIVQYIRTMTPLDRASGFGQLRANGIDLTLTSGRVGEMTVDSGRVEIPQFFPYGNDFTIEFEGRGPVDYMVELIDQKPFE